MRFNKSRNSPDEQRRRLVLLHDEIEKLDQVLQSATGGDPDATDAAVRRLRASIVHEELVRKRAELATLSAEARAAGIDVDQALRESPPSRIAPAASRSSGTSATRRRASGPLRIALVGMAAFAVVGVAATALLLLSSIGSRGNAAVTVPRTAVAGSLSEPVQIAPEIESVPVEVKGETFYTQELDFTYATGRVFLGGDPTASTGFSVDDGLRLQIAHPDGTTAAWSRDFNTSCIRTTSLAAQDVTNLFRAGVNRITVTLYDICGENRGTSVALWLSNRD